MTIEEEIRLILLAQADDREAMEELYKAHKSWISKCAAHFADGHFDDAFQQACLGFVQAVYKFDPTRSQSIRPVASYYIRTYLGAYYFNYILGIRQKDYNSRQQIIEHGVPVKFPLNEEVYGRPQELDDHVYKRELAHAIHNALTRLTARERYILEEHIMYERYTLDELAFKLGVSRQRVNQIEQEALRKLRIAIPRPFRKAA